MLFKIHIFNTITNQVSSMKKVCLLLGVLIFPFSLYCQNSYTYLTAKKLDSVLNLSLKYKENDTVGGCREYKAISELLKPYNINNFSYENPFLNPVSFDEYLFDYGICQQGLAMSFVGDPTNYKFNMEFNPDVSISEVSNPKSISSNNSNLDWQSAILLGTADFMVQRFKDELVNYALNQLLSDLKKEQLESIQTLFPKTINYIDKFLEPNQGKGFFNSDLEMLRYNAELDLQNIPYQIPEFIKTINPNQAELITFNLELISNAEIYSNPLNIFNDLSEISFINYSSKDVNVNQEMKQQIELVDIYVNALRDDRESNHFWIDFNTINAKKIDNDLTVRFFYALLFEQTKDYYNTLDDGEIRNKLISVTTQVAKDFNKIDSQYKSISTKKEDLNFSDYEDLIRSVFKSIDNITAPNFPKFTIVLNSNLELVKMIKANKYQYVLPNLFLILTQFNVDDVFLDRDFLNTLSLMIDFTLVKNPEQMKNLLSTYALPIGSSSLKRTGKFDISFNGYVGLTAGYEALDGDLDKTFFNLGLTAPIGVSFSHRYNTDGFISSGSIFLGILDIGALVNNSFDDSIELESDLSFKQFFVPSLGYLFNISNSPFSFGFVGSYHLDSRAFKASDIETEQIDSYRLNMSILVDIPFFTLKHTN